MTFQHAAVMLVIISIIIDVYASEWGAEHLNSNFDGNKRSDRELIEVASIKVRELVLLIS